MLSAFKRAAPAVIFSLIHLFIHSFYTLYYAMPASSSCRARNSNGKLKGTKKMRKEEEDEKNCMNYCAQQGK